MHIGMNVEVCFVVKPVVSFVSHCCPSPGGQSVIKAQVLAGGRGKGHFTSGLQGGVKLARR